MSLYGCGRAYPCVTVIADVRGIPVTFAGGSMPGDPSRYFGAAADGDAPFPFPIPSLELAEGSAVAADGPPRPAFPSRRVQLGLGTGLIGGAAAGFTSGGGVGARTGVHEAIDKVVVPQK